MNVEMMISISVNLILTFMFTLIIKHCLGLELLGDFG